MAANILAAEMGVDVHKILKDDPSEIKELQNLIGSMPKPTVQDSAKNVKTEKEQQIPIEKRIVETFGLPKNLSNEATRMADVYPKLYVLENLARYVVKSIHDNKGTKWWDEINIVPAEVKKKVKNRKKQEGKNRWHYKRGSHEIFYTDFGDLSSIISNNWKEFEALFPNLRWIQAKLEEVELSRNIVAHNNPLPKREFDRIDMTFEDLKKQLSDYIGEQKK
jgi:hypothetical protein